MEKKYLFSIKLIVIISFLLSNTSLFGQTITVDKYDKLLEFDINLNYNAPSPQIWHTTYTPNVTHLSFTVKESAESQYSLSKHGSRYWAKGMPVKIITPEFTDVCNPLPVIVYGYGGGFIFKLSGREYPTARALAKQGYIVVVPQYRIGACMLNSELAKRALWRALQDMRVVIRWVRGGMKTDESVSSNYCIDKEAPLTYVGWSAGALLGLHNIYLTEEDFDNQVRQPGHENFFERPYSTTGFYKDWKTNEKGSYSLGTTFDLGGLDTPTELMELGDQTNEDYISNLGENSLPDISVCISGALGEIDFIDNNPEETPAALLLIHDVDDGVVPYSNDFTFKNFGLTKNNFWDYPKVYGSEDVFLKIAENKVNFPNVFGMISIERDPDGPGVIYPSFLTKDLFIVDKDREEGLIYDYKMEGASGGESLLGSKVWRHNSTEYGSDSNIMAAIYTFMEAATDDFYENKEEETHNDFVPEIGKMYTINNDGLYLASDGESDFIYGVGTIPNNESAYDLLWYFVPTGKDNLWSIVRAHGGTKPLLQRDVILRSELVMGDLDEIGNKNADFSISGTSTNNVYNLILDEISNPSNTVTIDLDNEKIALNELNNLNSEFQGMTITESCTNTIYSHTGIEGGIDPLALKNSFNTLNTTANSECNSEYVTYIIAFEDKGSTTSHDLPNEAQDRPGRIALNEDDYSLNQQYINKIITDYGGIVYSRSRWLNAIHVKLKKTTFLSNLFDDEETAIDSYYEASDPNEVTFVDSGSNIPISFSTLNDPPDEQLEILQADRMHSIGYKGNGIKIGVVDLGFPIVNSSSFFNHLYNDKLTDGEVTFTYDYGSNTNNNVYAISGSEHGTGVMGVLAGYHDTHGTATGQTHSYFRGVSHEAEYSLRRVPKMDEPNDVLEAYNYTRAIEDLDEWGARVICSSITAGLAETDSDLLKNSYRFALEMAAERGIVVVQPVGDDGNKVNSQGNPEEGIRTPADATGILSVAGVDEFKERVSSSSIARDNQSMGYPNNKPDIAALGENVFSLDADNNLTSFEGTSYASAAIAGFAANLLQQYIDDSDDKNSKEIIDIINRSGSQSENPNRFIGHGVPSYNTILGGDTDVSNSGVYEEIIDLNENYLKNYIVSSETRSLDYNPPTPKTVWGESFWTFVALYTTSNKTESDPLLEQNNLGNLKIHIYYPKVSEGKKASDKPLPVVVYGYGGGFLNKYDDDASLLAKAIAKQGYIVVAPEYRIGINLYTPQLSARAIWRGLQDIRIVNRYARDMVSSNEKFSVDTTEPLIYLGWSSGAFLGLHNLYLNKTNRPEETGEVSVVYRVLPDSCDPQLPDDCNSATNDSRMTPDLGEIDQPVMKDGTARTIYPEHAGNPVQDVTVALSGAIGTLDYIPGNVPTQSLFLAHHKLDGVVPAEKGFAYKNFAFFSRPTYDYPEVHGSLAIDEYYSGVGKANKPENYQYLEVKPNCSDFDCAEGDGGGPVFTLPVIGNEYETWYHDIAAKGTNKDLMTKIFLFLDGARVLYKTPRSNKSLNQALDADNYANVYPNPVEDVFSINFTEENISKIEVYDFTGGLLLMEEINLETTNKDLDFSNYSGGIYFLKVYTTDGRSTITRVLKM